MQYKFYMLKNIFTYFLLNSQKILSDTGMENTDV